jgi:hypothetical protein
MNPQINAIDFNERPFIAIWEVTQACDLACVFTVPPLAAVGLSERGAREQNLKFRVKMEMTSTWYSSRRVSETYSGYKVLVEESTDRILGAHILGSEAGEVINLFALAIRSGMRAICGTSASAHFTSGLSTAGRFLRASRSWRRCTRPCGHGGFQGKAETETSKPPTL